MSQNGNDDPGSNVTVGYGARGRLKKMPQAQLNYFTHLIEGKRYGGWYRVVAEHELEVFGIGLMQTVRYAGADPETAACIVLDEFVRRAAHTGIAVPALGDELAPVGRCATNSLAEP
jgi:hypothetical protein